MSTTAGTHLGAFTPLDWVLFLSIGVIWGSSFLLIAIGLDAFEPGLVTWLRVVFGASVALAGARARQKVHREDFPGSSPCRSCGSRSRSRSSRSPSSTSRRASPG